MARLRTATGNILKIGGGTVISGTAEFFGGARWGP